ncbi:MAG: DinB family protein [Gemmatimonadota bacterium]|jgi:uncharacterized damage-inducible protein DinB
MTADQHFIDTCRHYVTSEYLPKIRRCVEALAEEDLWWRPNRSSNSVGNLVLHLAGNIRQWIVSGVGGKPDIRERAKEFAADGETLGTEWTRAGLLTYLEETLADVDATLAELMPEDLLSRSVIQGTDVTHLEAVFHAVEHFSMHTGQIIYVTKLRTAADLRFYEVEDGIARQNW